MVHYYDASWIPLKERIEINMVRRLGKRRTFKILAFYRKIKNYMKKIAKLVLFPIVLYRKHQVNKKMINQEYLSRIDNTIKEIYNQKSKEYLVFYNKYWLGVTSATKELFENLVDCGEIYRKKDIEKIGR